MAKRSTKLSPLDKAFHRQAVGLHVQRIATSHLSATTVRSALGVTTSRALAAESIPQARATKAVRAIVTEGVVGVMRLGALR